MPSSDRDARESQVDNPLRDAQRHAVRGELEGRLRHRGATLTGTETDDEILLISGAVDRFERAVMQAGGDLMVDTPESSRPDNPERVLPQRHADESADAYVRRVEAAADRMGTVR